MDDIRKARMVMVSFIISSYEKVIEAIGEGWRETEDSLAERRRRQIPGQVLIGHTEDCSVANLLENLADVGFEMVEATYKILFENRTQGRVQVCVKFVPHGEIEESLNLQEDQEEFERKRPQIEEGLRSLCQGSFWSVQAWVNSFFLGGHDVGRMASIVLKDRKPLYLANGKPVVARRKDKAGKTIDPVPVPIEPKYHLRVDDTIQLVPA
jgi:hypothetical protein